MIASLRDQVRAAVGSTCWRALKLTRGFKRSHQSNSDRPLTARDGRTAAQTKVSTDHQHTHIKLEVCCS